MRQGSCSSGKAHQENLGSLVLVLVQAADASGTGDAAAVVVDAVGIVAVLALTVRVEDFAVIRNDGVKRPAGLLLLDGLARLGWLFMVSLSSVPTVMVFTSTRSPSFVVTSIGSLSGWETP